MVDLRKDPQLNTEPSPMTPGPSSVSACGKVILAGEHAVVYGSHAVALPLTSLRIGIDLNPMFGFQADVAKGTKGRERHLSKHLDEMMRDASELLGLNLKPADVSGHSNLPIGAGVGSSAALCVATLRALSQSYHLDLDAETVASLANRLEQRFHGRPSGLDTAVVAFEQCILFKKDEAIKPIALEAGPQLNFVLIDSKVRASTRSMIQLASPRFLGEGGSRRIQKFDEISLAGSRALALRCRPTLGDIMNECHGMLSELGIVTKLLDDMVVSALGLGCLGAKATGAGGGGTILVLLNSEDKELQLSQLEHAFGRDHVFALDL